MKQLLWSGLIAAFPAAPFLCSCRRLKCQDYLLPIVIWLLSNPRFGSDSHLSGLVRPLGGTEGGSALTYCSICSTNVVYCDQKSTERACVSQLLQQSGLSRTSPPIGHFWPSKITSGVDYMLSSASPNYSPVLRSTASSQRNGVVSKHARPRLGGGRDGGQQDSQLQQPFYKTDKQHTNMFSGAKIIK